MSIETENSFILAHKYEMMISELFLAVCRKKHRFISLKVFLLLFHNSHESFQRSLKCCHFIFCSEFVSFLLSDSNKTHFHKIKRAP